MYINNFDQSSKGINLELSVCFDCDLSRMYFKENFEKLPDNKNQWFYTDGGNYPSNDFEKTFKIENKRELFDKYFLYKYEKNILLATYSDIKDFYYYLEITSLKHETVKTLLECIYNDIYYTNDYYGFLEDNFTPEFETVSVSGCCQGDYAEVIIPGKFFKDCNISIESIRDYIENLFFYAPLYIRLTIDDDDFYIDQYLENQYNYDIDEILNIFDKYFSNDMPKYTVNQEKYIRQFLVDNLPEYPEYSY